MAASAKGSREAGCSDRCWDWVLQPCEPRLSVSSPVIADIVVCVLHSGFFQQARQEPSNITCIRVPSPGICPGRSSRPPLSWPKNTELSSTREWSCVSLRVASQQR